MHHQGGGYKVNLFKKAMEPLKDSQKIILFTDRFDVAVHSKYFVFPIKLTIICSYDVVYTANLDVIVKKFKDTGAHILFGAEPYCWPDETVDHLYPTVDYSQARFLNSGMFIGESEAPWERS